MKVSPGNAQHQGAREAQEDSFAFSDVNDAAFVAHGGVLAVLSDGMGGLAHGGRAGAAAVRAFLARYLAKAVSESVPAALTAAASEANEAVLEVGRTRGSAGATLAAAVLHDGALHWISAGDSRIYLYRNQELNQLTIDQVYGVDLDAQVANRRLSRERAQADPDRGALTNHLGLQPLGPIDRSVEPLPLEAGDVVLLCSDGLYRTLSDDEIARECAVDPQDGCEALVQRAIERGRSHQDNITVMALRIDAPAAATASPKSTPPPPLPARATRGRGSALLKAALVLALVAITVVLWQRRRGPDADVIEPVTPLDARAADSDAWRTSFDGFVAALQRAVDAADGPGEFPQFANQRVTWDAQLSGAIARPGVGGMYVVGFPERDIRLPRGETARVVVTGNFQSDDLQVPLTREGPTPVGGIVITPPDDPLVEHFDVVRVAFAISKVTVGQLTAEQNAELAGKYIASVTAVSPETLGTVK